MPDITLDDSVGDGGTNLPPDVARIAGALVAIGQLPNGVRDLGGVALPPASLPELGRAIRTFQTKQVLPVRDGKVDRSGGTLRRINLLLNRGAGPQPGPQPGPTRTGELRAMPADASLRGTVDMNTWTPEFGSLTRDLVFSWTGVAGKGRLFYFEIDDLVVPRWYGVLVPEGTTAFDRVHLFFHPLPGQAGHDDRTYHTRGSTWQGIFRYLTGDRAAMGAQFCAAATGRVLIMPLMTGGSADSCGILPSRWRTLFAQMLGRAKAGDASAPAPEVPVRDVIVSSFSNGIKFFHTFRSRAGLGEQLSGVIDFDGGISDHASLSAAIRTPPGRVVRMHQMHATPRTPFAALAAGGLFPMGRVRWGGPYAKAFSTDPRAAMLQIHALVPQTTLFIACRQLP